MSDIPGQQAEYRKKNVRSIFFDNKSVRVCTDRRAGLETNGSKRTKSARKAHEKRGPQAAPKQRSTAAERTAMRI
ncbi:hypothetical protein [Paraburkholderia tropica]|uniref:hypothetical protein n=1 Tax=Paraburkholderia tropica TaxID=92647 RepID=UPI002AAF1454|nr:hypothetical protein [Paraburkholderia tropica]